MPSVVGAIIVLAGMIGLISNSVFGVVVGVAYSVLGWLMVTGLPARRGYPPAVEPARPEAEQPNR